MTSLLYAGPAPLVLASRSPRRHQLLRRLGVAFEARPADIEEVHPAGLAPAASAVAVAEQKARAVAAGLARGLVLGADTIVVLDGEILGKPRDPEHACTMLARLCGRTHVVITGLVLLDAARGSIRRGSESTRVTLRAATAGEIERYVRSGEPLDKAGAYGAQGLGAVLIDRVEGCFYNVVGLPIVRLYHLFQQADGQLAEPPAASGRPGNHPAEDRP